jgi:hypothetical protein
MATFHFFYPRQIILNELLFIKYVHFNNNFAYTPEDYTTVTKNVVYRFYILKEITNRIAFQGEKL